jgi:hypothetical protein
MSFFERFESKKEGIEDTIEFTIRMAITTLSMVIVVVVLALVVALFMPNELVDSVAVLEMINPAFQTIIGAFVGLLGGLSLNANARDAKPEDPAPVDDSPVAPTPVAANETFFSNAKEEPVELTEAVDDDDDDDDMAPWEKYRSDLRYDLNGDGVVDENDFPAWRDNLRGAQ